MRKMSYEEAMRFKDARNEFLDYRNIDEYIEDIVTCLVYSTWHYTEEEARDQCRRRMGIIENSFEKKEPAYDCAVDVGYCCG